MLKYIFGVRLTYPIFSFEVFCFHHSPALGVAQVVPELYLLNKKATQWRSTGAELEELSLAIHLWRMPKNGTSRLERNIRTICLSVALRNLPSVALNPRSYFHRGRLLWIHVVDWTSLNSLLYHGAFADWVNRRKASTWKKFQWLSASQTACRCYSNPTHSYGEAILSRITQNLVFIIACYA